MTKQELMETYTTEQLAEMVVNLEYSLRINGEVISDLENKIHKSKEKYAEILWEHCDSVKKEDYDSEVNRLQSEVEKYRKAFEGVKNERDCKIAEYQNRVDKDKTELERAKNTINQIDYILEKLFGVRHDTVDTPDEFEKILTEKAKGNVSDFLQTEPIKVVDMLINAEGEYEHSPLAKALYKQDKGIYRIFDVSELRQIAEHLLVYCNHNGEVEE